MRQTVLNYLQTQNLGTFIVSTELPWDENGVALYLKNLKKIYVNVTEYEMDPEYTTLNGLNISTDTHSVRVYFANDAKSLPPNYDEVVTAIRDARNITTTEGYHRREVDVVTTFDADRLVTEIELRYIKLT